MGGPGSGRRKKEKKERVDTQLMAATTALPAEYVQTVAIGSVGFRGDEIDKMIDTVPDIMAQTFLREYRKCGTFSQAARNMGISKYMHYYWLGDKNRFGPRHPLNKGPMENYTEAFEFLELGLLMEAEDTMTEGLRQGAVETTRDKNGEIIMTRHRNYETRLMELRLRALNRSKYGRDPTVQNNTLNVVFANEKDKM